MFLPNSSMHIPRLYFQNKLSINTKVTLDVNASKHILQVLRLKIGENLILFNGIDSGEYLAKLISIEKKIAVVQIEKFIAKNVESPLKIHLMQGIARGEKMDFIIQKAVELGVNAITPIFTEFCNVKISSDRLPNKLQHWQSIAQNATEQSGRIIVPKIFLTQNLTSLLKQNSSDNIYIVLDPNSKNRINSLSVIKNQEIKIFVGPEGGFSENEIELFKRHNFYFGQLGPRILRTETAALVAISILQNCYGDL